MFARIFTVIFFILLIADVYIFFLYIKKFTGKTLLRVLWFLPSIVLMAGLYLFFYSGTGYEFRNIFMIVFAAISLPKILFMVITLLDFPLRYFFKWKIYPFTVLALLLCVCVEFILIYGSTGGKSKSSSCPLFSFISFIQVVYFVVSQSISSVI